MTTKPTERKTTLVRISKTIKAKLAHVAKRADMTEQDFVDMAVLNLCNEVLTTKTITKKLK